MSVQDYEFDQFRLIPELYELTRAGRPIRLEKIPFDLLVLLVERRPELVSRDAITAARGAGLVEADDGGCSRHLLDNSRIREYIPCNGFTDRIHHTSRGFHGSHRRGAREHFAKG